MKIFPTFLGVLALAFVFVAGAAYAQAPADFSGEPALTEADISVFKAVLKAAGEAGADPEKAAQVYATAATAAGTTETHALYVFTKISTIQAVLSQAETKDQIIASLPDPLKPSEAEIALVQSHMADLMTP
ncbi:MAG: hypothetical protein LBE38_08280 [Deltaproteobacteria bacterium]|jgi:hypothetical protein|nr:hypothetical protein [Deltaproteobacteria bacterium]